MPGAEPAPGARHRAQRLLRDYRTVVRLHAFEAIVAVAASARVTLAKIREHHLAAASHSLAEAQHLRQLLLLEPLELLAALPLLDQLAQLHHLAEAVEEERRRGQSVAPRPARLLVVALYALRQVEVRDETDVRFVDAHPEGDGGADDEALLAQEACLVFATLRRVEPGVVGRGGDAFAAQEIRRLLRLLAAQAIDDSGIALVAGAQERKQLLAPRVLERDFVLDVGPVEARGEDLRARKTEPAQHLLASQRVGGRGQGDERHARKTLAEPGHLEIVRPEVVAPLAHAMRLVDGQQAHLEPAQEALERLGVQRFGRDVEELQPPARGLGADGLFLLLGQRRVVEGRRDPELLERIDLVLHQRDERRYDECHALEAQRRHLVAKRLAATGRHEDQAGLAGEDVLDDLGLPPAEGRIAEGALEDLERVCSHVA